jgi:hypothetical protein
VSEEPDLTLSGLSIWARSREFSESDDYWDGNWINIRARVEAPGAVVETSGPWIRSDEIAAFAMELAALHRDLRGTAALQCTEPMLSAKIAVGVRGEVEVIIEITPDHLTQSHRFEFAIDQSYLGATLSGCRRLLERFPVKGSPADG